MLHSKLPPAASLLLPALVDSPTFADILLIKLQFPRITGSTNMTTNKIHKKMIEDMNLQSTSTKLLHITTVFLLSTVKDTKRVHA
jgi:hypothetical protein